MVCIYCGAKTEIINTRHQKRSNSTWRRRKCLKCRALFTTIEQADYSRLWVVTNAQGQIRPFNRDKLFLSVYDSLRHRKTAISDSEGLVATIIAGLERIPSKGQLNVADIVDISLACLKRFDKTAAVYYQAYHLNKA